MTGFSRRCCFVTFDSFSDHRTLDRPGFGETFLQRYGIDAIHVLSRDNDWYQHDETLAAMDRVRHRIAGYARIVTYGSSMGAYAAIRLAGAVGAHAVLALSPQFSVLRDTAAFEYRWADDGDRIRPVWEPTLPVPGGPETYVFFDPGDLDARHVALYQAACPIVAVPLRGAGHPVTGFLTELGLLQRMVPDIGLGPLQTALIQREAWSRRRESAEYWGHLATRSRNPEQRIALLRHGVTRSPQHAGLLARLGTELGQMGRFDEAVACHRAGLALMPGHSVLLAAYEATLRANGAPVEPAASPRSPGRGTLIGVDPGPAPPADAPPILTRRGERGYAVFGPYRRLRPGRYVVAFSLAAAPGPSHLLRDRRRACALEVTIHNGRTVLARRPLSVAALRGAPPSFELPFEMPEWAACEFRVMVSGAEELVIQPSRPVRRVTPQDCR